MNHAKIKSRANHIRTRIGQKPIIIESGDQTSMKPIRRMIVIVLDGVGAGEAPDAADYGDVGSNSLGQYRPHPGRDRPAEHGRTWIGLHHPHPGRAACRAPSGRFRPADASLARQGHHLRPLGADGHPPGYPLPHLPGWLPAGGDRRVPPARRAGHFRQQTGFRHRDPQGAGRGAHAHRQTHRVHLGRQRLPDRRP